MYRCSMYEVPFIFPSHLVPTWERAHTYPTFLYFFAELLNIPNAKRSQKSSEFHPEQLTSTSSSLSKKIQLKKKLKTF